MLAGWTAVTKVEKGRGGVGKWQGDDAWGLLISNPSRSGFAFRWADGWWKLCKYPATA